MHLKFDNLDLAKEYFAKAGGAEVVEKATEEKNEEKGEKENAEKQD
jgi:predicted CopG family antitoxin